LIWSIHLKLGQELKYLNSDIGCILPAQCFQAITTNEVFGQLVASLALVDKQIKVHKSNKEDLYLSVPQSTQTCRPRVQVCINATRSSTRLE
jgi:hypothetical protein